MLMMSISARGNMSRRDFRRVPKKRLVVTWKRHHAPNRLRERGVHAKMEPPGDTRYAPRRSPGHDFLAKSPSPKRTSSVQNHSMSTKGLFFGNAWKGIGVTQDGELKTSRRPKPTPPRTRKEPLREFPQGLSALSGADKETRTLDPRITSAVLYQLSYIGLARIAQLQSLSDSHAFVGTNPAIGNEEVLPGSSGCLTSGRLIFFDYV